MSEPATIHPVDPESDVPLYEQVRTQVATRVAAGDLAPGTRLPTVRALADQLGIGVRTVQRVYVELEADGVVVTEGRRGTFVASATAPADAVDAAADFVATCRRLGLSLTEATRLVERGWS
ncbi:MAG: GntR family transcriptional regulator [Nocardioides sp.]|nr:GntR family transcriptional regulator [Nocardioides sp.]